MPHYFLAGQDAETHPWFWKPLALLRQNGADFSLLAEPEDCLPPDPPVEAAPMPDALMAGRHTCRRFLDRDVDRCASSDRKTNRHRTVGVKQ